MDKVQTEINAIRDAIIRTVPVDHIYLFGSYAYGTPDADSDLDFYVVMSDDSRLRTTEALFNINMAIFDIKSLPTDILVSKKSRFEERVKLCTLEREVADKGVVLYG